MRALLLSLVWALCIAPSVLAADKEPPAKPRALTIESLVNKNPVPKLLDGFPLFDPKYDWSEQGRVWDALRKLGENAEVRWPQLVKHLDDQRYCITLSSDGGGVYNWTVSDACREVMYATLAHAYYERLVPRNLSVHARMAHPRLGKNLRAWCQERGEAPLYELQAQACALATTELENLSAEDLEVMRISDATRRGWITAIKEEAGNLRKTKRAALCSRWFHGEFYEAFSAEEAESIRRDQPKKPQP